MRFDVFEYSNKGGRSYNEDSVGSSFYDDGRGTFVVADGLGGHLLGERASETAVEVITSLQPSTEEEELTQQLCGKIAEANQEILRLQQEVNSVMKTTVAALVISGVNAVWANVGDSRVYFIHQNSLYAYTNDHSVAFKKYKAGEITREQLATDEDQSRLLRSLGSEERYEPEVYKADVPLEQGDAFFICSDGAWEYLKDEEILIDFLKAESAERWAELMMLRIMGRINRDNDNLSLLTLILA
jgi:serine/threonine protein phosphatase PrpC